MRLYTVEEAPRRTHRSRSKTEREHSSSVCLFMQLNDEKQERPSKKRGSDKVATSATGHFHNLRAALTNRKRRRGRREKSLAEERKGRKERGEKKRLQTGRQVLSTHGIGRTTPTTAEKERPVSRPGQAPSRAACPVLHRDAHQTVPSRAVDEPGWMAASASANGGGQSAGDTLGRVAGEHDWACARGWARRKAG